MKMKKIPMRMCVVCRGSFEKRELLRVVRNTDGKMVFDPTGKMSGRGAYLCKNENCLEQGLKGKYLAKVLECEAKSEDILELKEAIYDIIGKRDKT